MSAKYSSTKDGRLLWCVLAALLLLGLIPAGVSAQTYCACGPAPAVKAALDQFPYYPSPLQTEWQYFEQQRSVLRPLLQQYPDDVFVRQTYTEWLDSAVDFHVAGADAEQGKLVDEFKSRHENDPDDPLSSYLYGYLLIGHDTPQAIKLFESALAKAPQFPWPHYTLLRIYNFPNFLNKDQATSHMRAFLSLCPFSLEGYSRLTGFDDKEMIQQGAVKLRALLQSRSDPDALGAYSTLWSLGFKAHPPAEYDPLRKQVGEDLKRLRTLNLQDKRQWYQALEAGYNLVNDQKQSDWAKEERHRRFPEKWDIPWLWKWYEDHKPPDDAAPAAKKREFWAELFKQSAEWVKERPINTMIWGDRVGAMEHLEDVPAAEVEAIVDQALQAARTNAGPRELSSLDFVNYLFVAEALSKRGLQPEREVEMAQKDLAQLEIESKVGESDLDTKQAAENNYFRRASRRIQGLQLEADGYLRLKQAEKAEITLAQMDERLQDLESVDDDKQSRKENCWARESSYWELMGRLAEFQNRKVDAMAYYENGLLKRLEAKQKPEFGVKDELADDARMLWKSLGGTDEGWRVWYGRQADPLAQQATLTWEEANLPLPSFQLTDLHGKTWQVADLKAKVTFLNFWASWCPECREELPHLQKLSEQYQSRHDVQFLTLNCDDNPGVIEPFLKEHQFKLTVLPAHRYVMETLKVVAIPQNWIVDSNGVVRLKGLGYDPGEKWETGMQEAIEKYKPEAGTAAAAPGPR
ncbi:MAG: TlpA family protein disulfide reductase [Terriglobia bacterium]